MFRSMVFRVCWRSAEPCRLMFSSISFHSSDDCSSQKSKSRSSLSLISRAPMHSNASKSTSKSWSPTLMPILASTLPRRRKASSLFTSSRIVSNHSTDGNFGITNLLLSVRRWWIGGAGPAAPVQVLLHLPSAHLLVHLEPFLDVALATCHEDGESLSSGGVTVVGHQQRLALVEIAIELWAAVGAVEQ